VRAHVEKVARSTNRDLDVTERRRVAPLQITTVEETHAFGIIHDPGLDEIRLRFEQSVSNRGLGKKCQLIYDVKSSGSRRQSDNP
jgi:hypothetical protein